VAQPQQPASEHNAIPVVNPLMSINRAQSATSHVKQMLSRHAHLELFSSRYVHMLLLLLFLLLTRRFDTEPAEWQRHSSVHAAVW
jgi:hypothetical protein